VLSPNSHESVIHTMNSASSTVGVPLKGDSRSLVMTRPSNVAPAAMAASGASYAMPHAKRCGFMMLNHDQSITPTHGRRSAAPAPSSTMAMTSRSRTA